MSQVKFGIFLLFKLFLRELLDWRIAKHLTWFDARDMATDGITKGSVDRAAIQGVMGGAYQALQKRALGQQS